MRNEKGLAAACPSSGASIERASSESADSPGSQHPLPGFFWPVARALCRFA